ncbi:unnamed protein product [Nesidiocoris tenuis]|uniref:Uncharacterized protein n=1 Tax=Nesidiocoris tenuis TaxID=355587 RepID=A0A6H5GKM1_9HEMI|nr:unnamed protein product [Nesidiocoris tenuis]
MVRTVSSMFQRLGGVLPVFPKEEPVSALLGDEMINYRQQRIIVHRAINRPGSYTGNGQENTAQKVKKRPLQDMTVSSTGREMKGPGPYKVELFYRVPAPQQSSKPGD